MAEKEYIEREALLDRVCAVRDKLQLDLNNPFEDGVRVGVENVEIEIENYPAAEETYENVMACLVDDVSASVLHNMGKAEEGET